MHCPTCNTLNRDDAKFCKGCGQPLQPPQAAPTAASEPLAEALNSVPTGDAQAAPLQEAAPVSAITSAPVEEAQEPVEAGSLVAEQPENDLSLEPTLILTPEKMVAYHQRRWSERANQSGPAAYGAPSTNLADAPTLYSSPAPSPLPVESQQTQGGDFPPLQTSTHDEASAAPIPPPPPPPLESLAPGEEARPEEAPSSDVPAEHNNDYIENGGYPELEKSEIVQDSIGHEAPEQTDQADLPEQPVPSGDFAVIAEGTTLQGRYQITRVLADNPQEHVYQVIDHQGYQRCWNCSSEHNSEGDDFCIDCGASLLDVPYIMHEYSAEQSKEDTPVLQGNIVNTFVDQERTYVIEQIQAEPNAFPNGIHLLAASGSDAGNIRRSDPNEDSALVLQLQRIHESLASPVGIFIVADGMGGHDNGQLASRMTINVIAERMTRELLLAPLAAEKEGTPAAPLDEDELVTLLHDAIEDANDALCQVNTRDKTDMGSTLTGFMIVGEHAYIVNVGDSRTYMVRGKQLYQLTTDHSLVGQLVASGLIEPDDVYTHPQRSQIYRSLGDKPNTQIDITKQQLHPQDILLSCCDGLWEMVRNPEIESTLNNAPDPQTACQQLIDQANTNGGEDNITAVIVYVQ